MKKSLVALAVLGAFAGAASAQSSVTLYGLVDVGLLRTDPKASNAASTTALDSGIQSGSRFGFRGSEDLGGGTRAVFLLENGYSADTGQLGQGGRIFGRWAYAGVAGGFGEVRLGRVWALGFEMFGSVDPFGTGFLDAGMQSTFSTANAIRLDNTFSYRSPALGPVRVNYVRSQQAAGAEVPGSGANASVDSLGFQGNFGPVLFVVTGERINNPSGASDQKHLQVGALVDVKVVKIHAAYGTEKDQFGNGPGRFGTVGIGNKAKMYMLGATVPVGPANIIFSWQNRDADITTSCSTAPTGAGSCDGRVYALGFTYPFSRRTNFYSMFADADAKNVTNSYDRKQLTAGLRHTF